MMARLSMVTLVAAAVVAVSGCAAPDASGTQEPAPTLGPVDGRDLPGTDLDRVQVGDGAPDFSLVSLAGPIVTLSDFRGEKNVILVFYRGYW